MEPGSEATYLLYLGQKSTDLVRVYVTTVDGEILAGLLILALGPTALGLYVKTMPMSGIKPLLSWMLLGRA